MHRWLVLSACPALVAALCDLSTCGPLNVSLNGHYLTYGDGKPFYYVADTPWHLFQDLNFNASVQYIERRLSQGFTALQLGALPLSDTPNANGDKFGSLEALNEPYWHFTEIMLKEMERRGMVAYMVPIWAYNWQAGASESEHFTFGHTLGQRWKHFNNILWCLGGDFFPDPPPVAKYRQLLAGLRAGGAKQLVTAHVHSGRSSSYIMPEELDFHSVQNRPGRDGDNKYVGGLVLKDFSSAYGGRHRPTLMVETWYEDEADGGVFNLHKKRGPGLREPYWGNRICGSFGEGYGAWGAWYSCRVGDACGGGTTRGWQHDINLPGAIDIARHMQQILSVVPWWQLQPDNSQAVPHNQNGLYVGRIIGGESQSVLAYTTHQQSFELLTDQYLGTANVHVAYYDPSGGEQAASKAFPVSTCALRGPTVTVPAHSWTGDAVVIVSRVEVALV